MLFLPGCWRQLGKLGSPYPGLAMAPPTGKVPMLGKKLPQARDTFDIPFLGHTPGVTLNITPHTLNTMGALRHEPGAGHGVRIPKSDPPGAEEMIQ